MNYLLKSKKENNIKNRLFIVSIIFFILFILNYFFNTTFFSFFSKIETPFFSLRDVVFYKNENFFGYFKSKSNLIQENINLKKEVENLILQKTELEAIKADFINIKDIQEENVIISSIISKPPFSPFDVLLLDRGSNNSVSIGDSVFISSSTYIGKVSFVSPNFSEVTLFSSSLQDREVYIQRTNANIKLLGQSSLNFLAVVPKDMDINEGDILLDKTFNSSIIAKVYKIDSTLQGSFKTIYAKFPFSFSDISFVKIRK